MCNNNEKMLSNIRNRKKRKYHQTIFSLIKKIKKTTHRLNIQDKELYNKNFNKLYETFDFSIEFLKCCFVKKFYNAFLENVENELTKLNTKNNSTKIIQQKNVMKQYHKELIVINLDRFLNTKKTQ